MRFSQVSSLKSQVALRKAIALFTAVVFAWTMICPIGFADTIDLEGGSIEVNVQDNTTNWSVTGNPVWTVPEFNVAQGSTYNIAGLGSGASLALLVNGGQASNIFGAMNLSNLAFILQNIAGINIGSSAMINLNNASLIASTLPLNLNVTDFLKQQYEFSGQGGFLTNDGKIVGNNADLVALVANAIENKGTIEVPMGTVALAAGDVVSIGISPDGMVSIAVDEATANTMGLSDQIKNSGTISAQGGRVVLDAKAIDGLFDKAINLTAEPNAVSVVKSDDGVIEFVANGDILNQGTLQADRGSITIETTGNVETLGSLEAQRFTETAASFHIAGDYHVGESFHDNLDNAITYTANTDVSGTINDIVDIIIDAGVTLTLTGATTFIADSDVNGTGAFLMDSAAVIAGGGYDLTIKASQASMLGSIGNVGVFTIQESKASSAPTFTSSPTATTWASITDFRITSGTLNRFTGMGISGAPYMIYDVYGLQAVKGGTSAMPAHFKLANDIVATSSAAWNGGLGFTPLTFGAGTFDGNFKTITGLTINRPSQSSVGLFGSLGGLFVTAAVQNLGLIGVSIIGGSTVGALVGYNISSPITNSYSTGSVSGGSNVGGLAGVLDASYGYANVTNSYSLANVSGSSYVGGLVGHNYNNQIVDSYARGNVTNTGDNTGGLVGGSEKNSYVPSIYSPSITNSYSTGTVTGKQYVGGLVGNNSEGPITNSYSTGNVTGGGTGGFVGGLVGWNVGTSPITNSYARGTVSSPGSQVGGLIGRNRGASVVTNSYATGSVTGLGYVGGLIGSNDSSLTASSYATGNVLATSTTSSGNYSGGLIGYSGGSITGSYATGNVEGKYWYVGGLAGYNVGGITNSFSTGTAKGVRYVGGLGGGNTSNINNSYSTGVATATGGATYAGGLLGRLSGGTLTNNWWYNATNTASVGGSTPSGVTKAAAASNFYGSGSGTGGAVYSGWNFTEGEGYWNSFANAYPHIDWEWSQSITTLLQLQNMRLNLSAAYTLVNDIDASPTAYWNWNGSSYLGFAPVGYSTGASGNPPTNPFTGTLDGNLKNITGLTINRSSENFVGLLGATSGATIQNVGLVGGVVTGGVNVGNLVGWNASSIANSYSTGNVIGTSYVGGLVGRNYSGASINNSYSAGTVNGTSYVGGLVGYNSSIINNSFSVSGVSGSSNVGGLVGNDSSGTLTNNWWYNALANGVGNGGSNEVTGQYQKAAGLGDFYGAGSGTGGAVYAGVTPWNFTSTWRTVSEALPLLGFPATTRITIAGDVYGLFGGTIITDVANVVLLVMGQQVGQMDTISGHYSFSDISVNANDAVLVYLNGYSVTGNALSIAGDSSTAILGLNIYGNALTLGYQSSGPVTNMDLSNAIQGIVDPAVLVNIVYSVDGATRALTVSRDLIISGTSTAYRSSDKTFAPGGDVTAQANFILQGNLIQNGNITIAGDYSHAWGKFIGDYTKTFEVGGSFSIPDDGTGLFSRYEVSNGYQLIRDIYDLQAMKTDLDANYQLYGNIDAFGAASWNSGAGFSPVGYSDSKYFSGTFDGNSHTISGLTINLPTTDNVGLFGYIKGATIKDVGLLESNVIGQSRVGGLVGETYTTGAAGSITNVYNTGSVYGTGGAVGGLVGSNYYPIMTSYATGNVTGRDNVGGLTGYNGSSIAKSYAAGDVVGFSGEAVGGLVGWNGGGIVNSYAVGDVSGAYRYVGGLVGRLYSGGITNSYAKGNVYGVGSDIGGLAGVGSSNTSITNSYATGNVSGSAYVGGLIGRSYSNIVNSYSTGTASGSYPTGGFIGLYFSGTLTNNWWFNEVNGAGIGSASSPDVTKAASASAFYDSSHPVYDQGGTNPWDFTNTWRIYEGTSFPVLSFLPIALRVVGITALSKTYDSTTGAIINVEGALLEGVIGGDEVLLDISGASGSFANKNAGAGKVVTVSGFVISGADASNYILVQPSGITADITAKALTLSGITASDKIYDATMNATLVTSGASLSGVIDGDTVSLDGASGIGTFADKNVGLGKAVSVSGFTLLGADASNYSITQPVGLTADITQRTLAVSAAGASKVYDATTTATVTLSDNRIAGDVFTDSYASASFADKNSDIGKTVSVDGISISGTDASNYILTSTSATATADITKAAVTLSGITASNKVYDATANATVSTAGATFAGKYAGDDLTVSSTGTFSDKNAATGKTVTLINALGGTDLNNYTVVNQGTTTADITKAAVTLSGITASNKVYDATANATVSTAGATFAGKYAGDDLTVSSTGTFSDKNAAAGKTVTLINTLGGTDLNNYTVVNQGTATADITKRTLTVSTAGINKVYDGNTTATVTLSDNRIAGDVLIDSYANANFDDKNAAIEKTISISGISISGTDASNYALASMSTTTTASITAKALALSGVTASSKVYDATTNATLVTSGASLAGVISGDTVSLDGASGVGTFADKNAGVGKAVTVSGFTLLGTDASNYSITQPAGLTADITKAAVTLSGITASNKVYDATANATVSTAGATFAGKYAGDDLTVSSTGTFSDKNAATGKTVTLINALGGTDLNNYTVVNQGTTTADITKAAVTLSGITASNKVYDATANATVSTAGATFAGKYAGDDLTVSSTGTFSDKNAAAGKTVTLINTLGGTDLNNYTVVNQGTATADITKRTLTVSATGINKVYDGNTTATVTLSDNRIAGDVLIDSYANAWFLDKYVGSGKAVSVSGISIAGADATNYLLSSTRALTTADITAVVSGAISGIGSGVSVALSLNGGTPATTTTTDANGSFSFGGNLFVSSGDSMLIYINNDSYKANLVGEILAPENVTGLSLARDQVSIGSANAVNLNSDYTYRSSDLLVAKGALTNHIYYSVAGDKAVTVNSGLNIAGKYEQDGNVIVNGNFIVGTNGVFTDADPLTHAFAVTGSFSVPYGNGAFDRYAVSGGYKLIRDIYDLQAMKSNLASNFKMSPPGEASGAWSRDDNNVWMLDASAASAWGSGTGFDPIGNNEHPFTGSLEGNGTVIRNLEMHRTGDYSGLFGYLGGSVNTLGLEDVSIYGANYVGGLAGFNAGTLSSVYTTGSHTVSGVNFVGGLVGGNSGNITDAYSSARVAGTDKVGGLAGQNVGTLDKTYAMGYVTGTANIGGLVGSGAGTVTDSYWDKEMTGLETSVGGTGKLTSEMMTVRNYMGWDMADTWVMDEGGSYAHFKFRYGEGVRGVWGKVLDESGTTPLDPDKIVGFFVSPTENGIPGDPLMTTKTGDSSMYYFVLGNADTRVQPTDYVVGGLMDPDYSGNTRMPAETGSITDLDIWGHLTRVIPHPQQAVDVPIIMPSIPIDVEKATIPLDTLTIDNFINAGSDAASALTSQNAVDIIEEGFGSSVAIGDIGTSLPINISGLEEYAGNGSISFEPAPPPGREPVPTEPEGIGMAGSQSGETGSTGTSASGDSQASSGGEASSEVASTANLGESEDQKSEEEGTEATSDEEGSEAPEKNDSEVTAEDQDSKDKEIPLFDWNFSDEKRLKKLLTDVRVIEGAVYVVDASKVINLLGVGESIRVFHRGKGKGLEQTSRQEVRKSAVPIVTQQMQSGKRYGTLKNPSKEVFVKSGKNDWQPAKDGMVILPGDEVKTASAASVKVMLDEGKVGIVEVMEGSLFRIKKAETDPETGDKTTLLDLAIGKVMIHAGKLQGASKFEVRTPTALTGVRGTIFEVTVKEKA